MKIRYLFIFFIIIFSFVYMFSNKKYPLINLSIKKRPDFVLEDSHIEHFVEGKLEFKINAKKIEIYSNNLLMYNATVNFVNESILVADKIDVNVKKMIFKAKDNVKIERNNISYTGSKIDYFAKEKKFYGYNGGKVVLK